MASDKKITFSDVTASIMKSRMHQRRRSWDETAAYTRRAMRRHDWNEERRRGVTPLWEVALAHVLAVESICRCLAGRLASGGARVGAGDVEPEVAPIAIGPTAPVTVLPYIEPDAGPAEKVSEADLQAYPPEYRYEGTTNGGISATNAAPKREDGDDDPDRDPARMGPEAFYGLRDGIPELAWYYSGSACELGFHSSWQPLVYVALSEGASSSSGVAPDGPHEIARRAARLQREIRARLRLLAPWQRVVLEIAYTDQRVTDLEGLGKSAPGRFMLHPVITEARGELLKTPEAKQIAEIQGILQRLHGRTKVKIPQFDNDRVARMLLDDAHAAYEATGNGSPKNRRKRTRKRPPPVAIVVPIRGYGRRRLLEVVVAGAA